MAELRIRPIKPEEAGTTAELIARVFPRDPSYVRLTGWYKWMLQNPVHSWDYVRVVELDGRIVSHLLLVERRVRARAGVLRAAGLSVVATLQDFQRRGLNRKLIEEALQFAARRGFAISLLDGIPDYYDRYGYAVVMPKYEVRLRTLAGLRLGDVGDVVEVKAGEAARWIPQLKRLYDREGEGLIGPAVRDEAYWAWLLEKGGTILLAMRQGEVKAYCWYDDKASVVEEACGGEPAAVRSLVRAISERAREEVAPELTFRVCPEAPFGRALLLELGGQVLVDFPRNAGWMGRILNLADVLSANLPEGWGDKRELCLETDLGSLRVELGPKGCGVDSGVCTPGVPRVRAEQRHLLQLLFGYAGAGELRDRGELEGDDSAMDLLGQVFPRVGAVLFPRDHF